MRILRGILLSLAVHLLLVWGAKYAPQLAPQKNSKETITVEILPISSQKETRQIVRDSMLPDKLKVEESEDPLRFLSEKTQRVKKQTQAVISGMTKNRSNTQASKNNKPKTETQNDQKNNPRKDFDAFAPGYRKFPDMTSPQEMESGLSSIGEALPSEVSVGSFTALNTDRYLYYSFFSRVEELIRFRWESAVRQTIDYTSPARLSQNARGIWVTQLQVLINAQGEIKAVKIMKESGLKGFDQSASQAFVQSRTLPNPPQRARRRGWAHTPRLFFSSSLLSPGLCTV